MFGGRVPCNHFVEEHRDRYECHVHIYASLHSINRIECFFQNDDNLFVYRHNRVRFGMWIQFVFSFISFAEFAVWNSHPTERWTKLKSYFQPSAWNPKKPLFISLFECNETRKTGDIVVQDSTDDSFRFVEFIQKCLVGFIGPRMNETTAMRMFACAKWECYVGYSSDAVVEWSFNFCERKTAINGVLTTSALGFSQFRPGKP